MKRSKQRGGGSLDLIFTIAMISCSLFLSPWFAAGFILLIPLTAEVSRSRSQRTGRFGRQTRDQIIQPPVPLRSAIVLHLKTPTNESIQEFVVDDADQRPEEINQREIA